MGARGSDHPRVRVAAFVMLEDRVVVVRHRSRFAAYHLLPGGGVDYRETLEAALVREVREETGLEVRVGDLLFVNDTIDPRGTRHVVNITFRAEIVGGSLTAAPQDDSVEAVELIEPELLSQLDLRPPMAQALQGVQDGPARNGYLGSLFTAGR